METRNILIGGQFVNSGEHQEVTSPFDGKQLARVAVAGPDAIEKALDSGVNASAEMRSLPRYRLREGLERISIGIGDRSEEFARSIALESGKPIVHARVEVDRAVSTFRIAAAEAQRFAGEIVPVDLNAGAEGRFANTAYLPRGLIFGISPFNYPLNLVAHKVAPALASGNAVIIKPSEKTPLTSLMLGEVFLDSGLPESAFQVVLLDLDLLEDVLHDERVKMISFTGSDKVGWMLKERYPKKAFALELGGNAPVIVDRSANLEDAAARIAAGAFAYSGQVCISVQRVLVQESVESPLVELLKKRAQALKRGDPLDDETEISAMISAEAAKSAVEMVAEAVAGGAKIICGGNADGAFLDPTLVENVDPEMRIVSEEIFAPVATIEPFTAFGEAIELANRSRFGLQAGVFTNDLEHAGIAAEMLEYGGVMINDVPTFRVDNMPYGGIKDSGIGREGVRFAMEEMCELKIVVTRHAAS